MASRPSTKKKAKTRQATYVVKKGTVTALAGGPLSLADMGKRTTQRASHVEWSAYNEAWVVFDPATDKILYQNEDYDVCLEWERVEFNKRLQ